MASRGQGAPIRIQGSKHELRNNRVSGPRVRYSEPNGWGCVPSALERCSAMIGCNSSSESPWMGNEIRGLSARRRTRLVDHSLSLGSLSPLSPPLTRNKRPQHNNTLHQHITNTTRSNNGDGYEDERSRTAPRNAGYVGDSRRQRAHMYTHTQP